MQEQPLSPSRIHAIDVVRGFCLVNIFVNHVTLGLVYKISPSKIFLFDSAEVFVLLSGLSVWLAYGPRHGCFDLSNCRERMWSRAVHVYLVNLLVIGLSFAVLVVCATVNPPPDVSTEPSGLLEAHGWGTYFWHLITMQQSVGYSMVLRLYFFLMVIAPVYVWLAIQRWYWPPLFASLIWLAAGSLTIVSRDSLTGQWLSMTVLPWNLVFAAGISLGAAITSGLAFPRVPGLVPTCVALAVGGILLLVFGSRLPDVASWLAIRNDHFWTGASKSLQSPLRLLHLAAVVSCVFALPNAPLIRLIHQAGADSFLARLGRRSLQVFAFGAVYALVVDQALWSIIQTLKAPLRGGLTTAVEVSLIAVGLMGMALLARNPSRSSTKFVADEKNLMSTGPAFAKDSPSRQRRA